MSNKHDWKWKGVDNSGVLGALLTHVYKAFDCLHQKLLTGNLDVSLWWPTAAIEKRHQKPRKNFQNRKNILESRKLFQNPEKCFTIEKYSASRIEKKNLNSITLNSMNLPADIYLVKVNNRNTRKRCEICSKLIINTAEWLQ